LRFVLAALFWALLLHDALAQATAVGRRRNVILISVDTLRADRLSCYSASAAKTPGIDRLSRGATLFTQASSTVPLTLPSHTSMLTSTYPLANGVEDNGDRLAPHSTTLASILQAHGYRTAAFLSGFVLDRRFGLDQGFETYDSPANYGDSEATDAGDIKQKGEHTEKAAEQWLTANSSHPFFLFLHLYDLHTPYNLSSAERHKYGDGYSGELAYVDAVMGSFLDYLTAHKLMANSLIVFTADHGEGLGDHGESTHGFFIYQSTLHVPLMVHWPADEPTTPGPRVDEPVSLLDVAPTILAAAHLPIPSSMRGRSLLAASDGPEDIYGESIYPQIHFDASPLASLRRGRYKYIDAPQPEFYELTADPGETHNLYAARESLASAYRERLHRLQQTNQPSSKTASATLSPDAVERLHALGYMTGSRSARNSKPSGTDPKDRIAAYEEYGHALELASSGNLEDADGILKTILSQDPKLSDLQLALGLNEQRLGKDGEALKEFQAVLAVDPENAIAHLDEGLSEYNLRDFNSAGKEAGVALAISPGYTKAEVLLAKTLGQTGEIEKSAAEFRQILAEHPGNYDALDGLGTLAAMRGDWDESVKQLQAALSMEPEAAETHNTLGSVYVRKGEMDAARSQFEEAVRLKPNYTWAHYNLALVLLKQGDPGAARLELQKALAADPGFEPARNALSRMK